MNFKPTRVNVGIAITVFAIVELVFSFTTFCTEISKDACLLSSLGHPTTIAASIVVGVIAYIIVSLGKK